MAYEPVNAAGTIGYLHLCSGPPCRLCDANTGTWTSKDDEIVALLKQILEAIKES